MLYACACSIPPAMLGAAHAIQAGAGHHAFIQFSTRSCGRRYKVVSHPNAVNPYPYAFLNFRSNFQLRKITLTDETFMEWEGTFDTELTVRCACVTGAAVSKQRPPKENQLHSVRQSGRNRKMHAALSACLWMRDPQLGAGQV